MNFICLGREMRQCNFQKNDQARDHAKCNNLDSDRKNIDTIKSLYVFSYILSPDLNINICAYDMCKS